MKPEQSQNFDISYIYLFSKKNNSLSGTFFSNEIEDLISWVADFPGAWTGKYKQISRKIKREGFEIENNYKINEKSNLSLVKSICDFLDQIKPRKDGSTYNDLNSLVTDRPGHDFRYSMTSKKISNDLNWKLKTSFEKGLEKTIEWYLNNPDILNNISKTVLDYTPWKNN